MSLMSISKGENMMVSMRLVQYRYYCSYTLRFYSLYVSSEIVTFDLVDWGDSFDYILFIYLPNNKLHQDDFLFV